MKNRVCFGAISGAFLLMVLLFAACSSTPPVKYYTLNTLPEMQQDVSEDASDGCRIGADGISKIS
jgi:uncharacterized lipoprotein YmbA